jgi:hypothetical protein
VRDPGDGRGHGLQEWLDRVPTSAVLGQFPPLKQEEVLVAWASGRRST